LDLYDEIETDGEDIFDHLQRVKHSEAFEQYGGADTLEERLDACEEH